jgi:DNA-directed RNA polymerase I subunit RPA1
MHVDDEEEEEEEEVDEVDWDSELEEGVESGEKRKGGRRVRSGSETSESGEEAEKDEMDVDRSHSSSDEEGGRVEEEEENLERKQRQTERIITPQEVRAHLRLLFKSEHQILSLIYTPHGPLTLAKKASADIFFMDVIAVPPTRFRPASTMGDQVFENPQNALLNGILRQTFLVRDLAETYSNAVRVLAGGEEGEEKKEGGGGVVDKVRIYTRLLESLIGLQVAVNSMMDNGKNPMVVRGGKLPPAGVKQLLEKKEGLFRKNMMVRLFFLSQLFFREQG